MKRKIVNWEKYVPPTEWRAVLACGHKMPGEYDHYTDSTKEALEKAGEDECRECEKLAAKLEEAEAEVEMLRAMLKRSSG